MPFLGFIRGYLYYIRFVSRPYRDAGLLVVLSRHCEDSVLLYRVMQGLVPAGRIAFFYIFRQAPILLIGGIRFWKSEKQYKIHFWKSEKYAKDSVSKHCFLNIFSVYKHYFFYQNNISRYCSLLLLKNNYHDGPS